MSSWFGCIIMCGATARPPGCCAAADRRRPPPGPGGYGNCEAPLARLCGQLTQRETPMFAHNKRLQYTVRVRESNPGLANLLLEQFGGPQGELAAACRYFTQALGEDDPGRKDMLFDIATEELSHLEVIGTLVAMLNKGAKGKLAEGVDAEADLYRSLHG